LQSSLSVLGICCTDCKKLVNYAYSDPEKQNQMLFWTKDKKDLVCFNCKSKHEILFPWIKGRDKLSK
jgi:hypothetical protein